MSWMDHAAGNFFEIFPLNTVGVGAILIESELFFSSKVATERRIILLQSEREPQIVTP